MRMTVSLSLTRRAALAGATALLALRPVAMRPAWAQEPVSLIAAEAKLPFGDAVLAVPALNDLAAGPELQLRRGEPFALRLENRLDFDLHFRAQGLRGKPVKGAEAPVKPGEIREIVITPPDAGSFVYACGSEGGQHVTRTLFLSGPLIVTADQPPIADRDVVLAVNTIVVPGETETAPARRVTLINGKPALDLTARPGERLRLRVINLAQEALAGLKLPADAQVIALDGQPCAPFPPLDGIGVLPPLGRADVALNIPDEPAPLVITDAFEPGELVKIAVAGEKPGERFLAKSLAENLNLPKEIPFPSAARATWKPTETANDPLLSVKAGTSVILTLENDATPRAVLLEGMAARHLDAMDDGWKPWWHDTLVISPDETVRLAFIPRTEGRYAIDLIPLEGNGTPTRAWLDVT